MMMHENGGDRGTIRRSPGDSTQSWKQHLLFAWLKTSFGTCSLFTYIIFACHCFLPRHTLRHHNVVCPKRQMYSGSCQEVSSSLATEVKWERCWGVPTDMSTCVSFLMTAPKNTQVSKGYPSAHSVNAVCFPADHIASGPPARFLLYLSNATQVVQERWRRCLGSW